MGTAPQGAQNEIYY